MGVPAWPAVTCWIGLQSGVSSVTRGLVRDYIFDPSVQHYRVSWPAAERFFGSVVDPGAMKSGISRGK